MAHNDHDDLTGADEELMTNIRQALAEVAAVPPEAVAAARAAYQLHDLDNELELLTMLYDSSIDESAGARSTAFVTARYMTFQGKDISLEVEVSADAILGQVVPPQRATVSILSAAPPSAPYRTDELGGFTLAKPASGPIRLTCRTSTGTLQTDWISI